MPPEVRKERQSTERHAVVQGQLMFCHKWRSFSSNSQQIKDEENRDSVTAGTKHYGCTANWTCCFPKSVLAVARTGHLVYRTPIYQILKRKDKCVLWSRQVFALVTWNCSALQVGTFELILYVNKLHSAGHSVRCYQEADVNWRIFATSVECRNGWIQCTSGYLILVWTLRSPLCCLHCKTFCLRSRHSSVSVVTTLRAGRQGLESRQGQTSGPATGRHLPFIQLEQFSLSSRVNRPGREADLSRTSVWYRRQDWVAV
jgi:hypothetical protein